jgi:predicted DNA-binding protein
MTTITCKISEKLDAELEAAAEKRGITKSELVRESIERNLKMQQGKRKLTAFDVMKQGQGIVHGARPDLATNPDHLRGFGRD